MVSGERVAEHRLPRGALRQLARLLVQSVVAGALASLVLALAVFIVATRAQAATAPAGDIERGALLLRDDAGARATAPLLFTDVHIDVSGLAARATVTQRFVDPTDQWREGVYVFPLPERAAVDHLGMRIGERVIEGRIQEKQAARAAYEQAKSEGRKATLVERERPNMFTTNVAQIGPREIAVSMDGRTCGLLMVLPPTIRDRTAVRPPREITYMVDTSGSMEGVSIAQAREALLRARRGTEMKPALEAAFAPAKRDDLMRQIVFLTDGAVGNEAQLLQLIARRLDDRRLFTVGIGPVPNGWLMKKAAEAGRGTYTFIGDAREVKDKMAALVHKPENPVLAHHLVSGALLLAAALLGYAALRRRARMGARVPDALHRLHAAVRAARRTC